MTSKKRHLETLTHLTTNMKPAFHNFTENLIRFNEWCEKDKKKTIKKFNPEEYKRLYEKSI